MLPKMSKKCPLGNPKNVDPDTLGPKMSRDHLEDVRADSKMSKKCPRDFGLILKCQKNVLLGSLRP